MHVEIIQDCGDMQRRETLTVYNACGDVNHLILGENVLKMETKNACC